MLECNNPLYGVSVVLLSFKPNYMCLISVKNILQKICICPSQTGTPQAGVHHVTPTPESQKTDI